MTYGVEPTLSVCAVLDLADIAEEPLDAAGARSASVLMATAGPAARFRICGGTYALFGSGSMSEFPFAFCFLLFRLRAFLL